MSASQMAQLLREIHLAEPTHEMHEQLVRMADQRIARIDEKIASYQQERLEAVTAAARARDAQAEFAAAHPEPQQAIFP